LPTQTVFDDLLLQTIRTGNGTFKEHNHLLLKCGIGDSTTTVTVYILPWPWGFTVSCYSIGNSYMNNQYNNHHYVDLVETKQYQYYLGFQKCIYNCENESRTLPWQT